MATVYNERRYATLCCYRCHEHRPRTQFPPGRGHKGARGKRYTRISSVCMACIEAEAYERDARKSRRCATVAAAGRHRRRRCADCGKWKDLHACFNRNKTEVGGHSYICKLCARERLARQPKREPTDEQRRGRLEASARWRAKPETQAYLKAKRAREYAEMQADDERYRVYLEDQRMASRMRREREGKPPRPVTGERKEGERPRRVPSAPLASVVAERIDANEALAEVMPETKLTAAELCADLTISERTFRRWRAGEQPNVKVDVAERVLLALDVEWHEVYSYDDHAEAFLAIEVEA